MEQERTELDHSLAALAQTRAELLSTLAGLDAATLARKGVVGDWSIKNILAHLAAWEEWVAAALPQRVATGRTPADFSERAENEDRFNEQEVAAREPLTPAAQIAELEQIRVQLVAYLRGLDSATLTRTQPWDSWPGTIPAYLLDALGQHEAEHVAALREAVAALGGS